MADNKVLPATGTGTADIRVATRTVTYSGDSADVQVVGIAAFAGSDDAKTVVDVAAGEGAATGSLRVDLATDGTVIGIVTESAPATDTASSGLNGRLQRIAQRITSLIALLPTALVNGALQSYALGSPTNVASQVTVTNASTSIVAARATRSSVLLVNNQTVAVYIDPTGGTAATTHFRLDPGASITLTVTTAVTGITSSAYTAVGDAKVHLVDFY